MIMGIKTLLRLAIIKLRWQEHPVTKAPKCLLAVEGAKLNKAKTIKAVKWVKNAHSGSRSFVNDSI